METMGKFSREVMMTSCILLIIFGMLRGIEGEQMRYKDPKKRLNVRLKDLLKRMSLEEKIGQMTQIERSFASPTIINKYFIGSVISGGGSSPSPKASAKEWVNMINDFQKGALSTRLGIPIYYGADAIHGHNNVFNATIFPHNIGLGATRDPALVKRIGAAVALEVRATGIHYNFAPGLAVCRDPRWGECFESFGEDTNLVREMTEIIPGLQGDIPPGSRKGLPFVAGKTKVAACAKYFVGDGGTVNGTDGNVTLIDYYGMHHIHMPPYLSNIQRQPYQSLKTGQLHLPSPNAKSSHCGARQSL